jgi:mRNA interferase YafQ
MWVIIHSKRFTKDLARMQKRGYEIADALGVVDRLRTHGQAEQRSRPHKLTGEWEGCWECHIGFNWLLVYTIKGDAISLSRTGTHEDLFG